jgi:hypothetical protein
MSLGQCSQLPILHLEQVVYAILKNVLLLYFLKGVKVSATFSKFVFYKTTTKTNIFQG